MAKPTTYYLRSKPDSKAGIEKIRRNKERRKQILRNYLETHPNATIGEIAIYLKVARNTVANYLKELD